MRLSRRITKDSLSRRIMRLVPVFILETHNQTNYKCLPKFIQMDDESSGIKMASDIFVFCKLGKWWCHHTYQIWWYKNLGHKALDARCVSNHSWQTVITVTLTVTCSNHFSCHIHLKYIKLQHHNNKSYVHFYYTIIYNN